MARAQADAANSATNAAAASGPALAAAEEAARIARIGYREGKFGQLDLLDAARKLAQTRAAAIDALLSYHLAQAQIERLTARAPITQGDGQMKTRTMATLPLTMASPLLAGCSCGEKAAAEATN